MLDGVLCSLGEFLGLMKHLKDSVDLERIAADDGFRLMIPGFGPGMFL